MLKDIKNEYEVVISDGLDDFILFVYNEYCDNKEDISQFIEELREKINSYLTKSKKELTHLWEEDYGED